MRFSECIPIVKRHVTVFMMFSLKRNTASDKKRAACKQVCSANTVPEGPRTLGVCSHPETLMEREKWETHR